MRLQLKRKTEIISGKKYSEKLRRERKTDSHSKFNQGQAKMLYVETSVINIMFIHAVFLVF